MKFTCSQQTLTKALNTVSKAVTSRTTLPILKGILMKASSDGTLTLSASDLDLSIEKKMDVNVEEEGEIVVLSKLFSDIIRKLPNEDILIEEKENNTVLIKTSYSEFTIVGPVSYTHLDVYKRQTLGERIDSASSILATEEGEIRMFSRSSRSSV